MSDEPQAPLPEPTPATPIAANRRSVYRLHFSTYITLLLTLGLLVLVVVPGHEVLTGWNLNRTDGGLGAKWFSFSVEEHGWPFIHLKRVVRESMSGPGARGNWLRDFDADRAIGNERVAWATADEGPPRTEEWWTSDGEPEWLSARSWDHTGYRIVVCKTALLLNLLTVAAICASTVVPYEWWCRRRWQFRIHSLFLLTLLLALALSWWRVQVVERDREQGLCGRLEKLGFITTVRCGGPVWLCKLVGAAHLPFLWRVDYIWGPVSAQDLATGGTLSGSGAMADTSDRRRCIEELCATIDGFHGLRRLVLTKPDDWCLDRLPVNKTLLCLCLNGSTLTDDALHEICKFPSLDELWIEGTVTPANPRFTARGLQHLKSLKLRSLHLSNAEISDDGLAEIAELHGLEVLSLEGCIISDAGAACLTKLRNLKELDVTDTPITDDAAKRLEELLPETKVSPSTAGGQ